MIVHENFFGFWELLGKKKVFPSFFRVLSRKIPSFSRSLDCPHSKNFARAASCLRRVVIVASLLFLSLDYFIHAFARSLVSLRWATRTA
jgi:hypothetical protein